MAHDAPRGCAGFAPRAFARSRRLAHSVSRRAAGPGDPGGGPQPRGAFEGAPAEMALTQMSPSSRLEDSRCNPARCPFSEVKSTGSQAQWLQTCLL